MRTNDAAKATWPAVMARPDKLRSQKYTVMTLVEVKPNESMAALSKLNPFKNSVKPKDLVIFSRQLATLVGAGVPIVQKPFSLVELATAVERLIQTAKERPRARA